MEELLSLEQEVESQINKLMSKGPITVHDMHEFAHYIKRRTKMSIRMNMYKHAQCNGGNIFLDTKELDAVMEGYSTVPEGSILSYIKGERYFLDVSTGKKYPVDRTAESRIDEDPKQLKFDFA